MGPAIFVAVDPVTLNPAPRVGDRVSFVTTAAGHVGANANTILAVTALTSFTRTNSGLSIAGLVQNVSATDFSLVGNIDALESELVTATGRLTSGFTPSGQGFVAASVSTAGTTTAVKFRLPSALAATFPNLRDGCLVHVTSPLGRYGTTAQLSASTSGDFTFTCPPANLLFAVARDPNTVVMGFDRSIEPTSVTTTAFSISGLSIGQASLPSPTEVVLATSPQSPGAGYTVFLGGLRDLSGNPPASTTAPFFGFRVSSCAPSVLITQFYPSGASASSTFNARFVELFNRTPNVISLSGYSLQYASASGNVWSVYPLSGTIASGGFFLVQLGLPGGTGSALPTPDLTVSLTPSSTSGGKIALVQGTTPNVGCPSGVELLGYGGVTCFLGSASSVPGQTSSLSRSSPCVNYANNSVDFALSAPAPRRSVSSTMSCLCN
mgnify:FL=1